MSTIEARLTEQLLNLTRDYDALLAAYAEATGEGFRWGRIQTEASVNVLRAAMGEKCPVALSPSLRLIEKETRNDQTT